LFESIIGEYTDIAGYPIVYYRAKSKMDRLYGEDPNQEFHPPVETKLYYEPSDEPFITDMMNLRSDDTLQYGILPKLVFSRDVLGGEDYITGAVKTLHNLVGGSGYSQGTRVSTTALTGSGTGLTLDIRVNNGGAVIHTKIEDVGSGYAIGDVVQIGDGNATVEIHGTKRLELRPMPGDVIKTLWNDYNYEIVDIGDATQVFMANKLIWEFILRPYRFSEQSDTASDIHYSTVQLINIYIHPDGQTVDLMYADGTSADGLDISVLETLTPPVELPENISVCDSLFIVNPEDGSVELEVPAVIIDPDDPQEGEYEDTGKVLKDRGSKTYGDDSWVEIESDEIDDYGDVDTKIFGY
jgi:hypothetical protein